uniref:Uncharacterized protein n=1 Tax=Helianthus annuus TaxID=4232 RepID=A0A251U7T4_HELAN
MECLTFINGHGDRSFVVSLSDPLHAHETGLNFKLMKGHKPTFTCVHNIGLNTLLF